jgi:hypothetical protein
MKGRSDMNMMAKVKLIFYAIIVFSIYLYAIFYSFGDHDMNLNHTSSKQIADSSDEDIRRNVQIKFIVLNSSGSVLGETDILIKNQDKKTLKVQTNSKGEYDLTIEPGTYDVYLERNRSVQKQVTIHSKDDGKSIVLKF